LHYFRSYMVARPRILAVLLVAAAVLAACATPPRIRASTAPGVDFATFKTFGFVENLSTDRAGFHTLVTQQLMFSTQREMEVRGLTLAPDRSKADLLINFHADVAEQLRVRNTPPSMAGPNYWNHRTGMYRPWPGHRGWPVHNSVEVQQITTGTLSVDVVDARNNMLVWEGVASQQLTQRTLNDLGPALDDAVHLMFRDFPVAPTL